MIHLRLFATFTKRKNKNSNNCKKNPLKCCNNSLLITNTIQFKTLGDFLKVMYQGIHNKVLLLKLSIS